jgi:hypothetical protein
LTDQFGQTFQLDLLKMYEISADSLFYKKNFELAYSLYRLSNIREEKLIKIYIESKQVDKAIAYLSQKINNPSNLSKSQRKSFSDLLFKSYMYKITSPNEDINEKENDENFKIKNYVEKDYMKKYELGSFENIEASVHITKTTWSHFRNFLNNNEDYEATYIIDYLVYDGFISLAIELGYRNNVLPQTMQYIIKYGKSKLSEKIINFLYENKCYDIIVENEILFNSEDLTTQIKFLFQYLKTNKSITMLQKFLNMIEYINDQNILIEVIESFYPNNIEQKIILKIIFEIFLLSLLYLTYMKKKPEKLVYNLKDDNENFKLMIKNENLHNSKFYQKTEEFLETNLKLFYKNGKMII